MPLSFTSPYPPLQAMFTELNRLSSWPIELTLNRIERVLAALGNPERRLPLVYHVAGTNGKGSTVAFLRAFHEAAGRRVHVFTSPHLVQVNERIRLAGALISDEAFAGFLGCVLKANAGEEVTPFEAITATAFLAFAEVPADICVIEVGLGGRMDATNVLPAPACAAITRISYDHQAFLGDTLAAIAGEKAGIVKPGVPVVLAPQAEDIVRDVVSKIALKIGAPFFSVDVPESCKDSFLFDGAWYPHPALSGVHQLCNAATALACLEQTPQVPVSMDERAHGLRQVEWPARLQDITATELGQTLPRGSRLVVDGGHNDSAGQVLAEEIVLWPKPVWLICGMLKTKEAEQFLRPLVPHLRGIITISVPAHRETYTAEELAAVAKAVGIQEIVTSSTVEEALEHCQKDNQAKQILIAGSLYLAGKVLSIAQGRCA